MATSAVVKPLEEAAENSLKGMIKEKFLPALMSGYRFLERSSAGKFITSVSKDQIEPMAGKIEASGRQTIDKLLSTVPTDLHEEVLKSAKTGMAHTNIHVNSAAAPLYKIFQAASHLDIEVPTTGKTTLANLMTWNRMVAHEQAQRVVLGPKRELLTSAVVAAGREKGPWYAKSMADDIDVIFGLQGGREAQYRSAASKALAKPYEEGGILKGIPPVGKVQPIDKFDRTLSNAASQTMTSLVAIPHLPQGPLHSLLVNGTKATVKAFGDVITGKAKNWAEQIIRSGAFEDDIYYMTMQRENTTSAIGKFMNKIRQPGFTSLRKWHIGFDALAAKYSAEEHAAAFVGGDKSSIINLKLLGLDPDKIKAQGGKLLDDDIEQAMYRGTNETMFKRHSGQTPYAWETDSVRRLAFMYKHYYFNVGRLFKDSLVRAVDKDTINESGFKVGKKYVAGGEFNKTLAIMATVFPAVGWMAMQVKNVATGKAPGYLAPEEQYTGNELADQYINAIGYGGGLAMAMTMAHSARRRSIAAYIAGPHISTAADWVEDSYNMVRTGKGTAFAKDITRRIPVVGGAVTNVLFPAKEKKEKETY